jgi:hypothetical protein
MLNVRARFCHRPDEDIRHKNDIIIVLVVHSSDTAIYFWGCEEHD